MSLEAYSRTKDGGTLLSPNFRVREFACRDGSDPVFIDSALVDLLQRIRDHFGQPVTITSGYRTARHNAAVGGAAFSQHCYGRAADIRVKEVAVDTLADYAETLLPGTRRHRPLPGKEGPRLRLGAPGRARGKGPLDRLKGGGPHGEHPVRRHCRGGDPDRRADRKQPQPGRHRYKTGGAHP